MLIEDTTLAAIAAKLNEQNGTLDAAVATAQKLKTDAEAEDERLEAAKLKLIYTPRRAARLPAPPEETG